MKKVVTINLSGRAFQMDEPAYEAVQDYLEKAKRALSKDPDAAEILSDLEQSIADKSTTKLTANKTVLSEADVKEVLAALGPVESAEPDEASASDERLRRRLFIIKDGAMLAGVCKGLSVYLGTDVTIIRIIVVVLTILTHGVLAILYIMLALLLPKADDSEKLAAAYGYEATAQELVERARRRATDPSTLDGIGRGLNTAWRIFFRLSAAAAMAFAILMTIGYGVGLWAIALGRTQLVGSLAQYNGWPQWLGLTAAYLAMLLPLLFVYRLFNRWAMRRSLSSSTLAADLGLLFIWILAVVSTISLLAFAAADFRNYANQHDGYIDFQRYHLCVSNACQPQTSSDGQNIYYTCPGGGFAQDQTCDGPVINMPMMQ